MEIYIIGIKLRAVTDKLCDFLSDSGAKIWLSQKDGCIDAVIDSSCFSVEFDSDERDTVVVRTVNRGKKVAYTFDSADIDKVAFM